MARSKYNSPTYELTPQQLEAVDLLLSGKTVTETAAALDVARETVSRWKNADPGFKAAYNAGLLSSWEASHKRLMDARARAIDKLTGLLDNEDPQIVLKTAAVLVKVDMPQPDVEVSPARIDRRDALNNLW